MSEGSQNWSWGCCHPTWWLLRSWGMQAAAVCCSLRWTGNQGWPPDSWAACGSIESSESRGLHLPTHRTLHSLTWHLIFDVQTPCSLRCKLVYSLTSPAASLEQFSQSYWDAVSGLRVLSIPTTENNSTRFWLYFSVNKGILLGRRVWMWTKFRCFF